ncbi:hypothetical protein A2U01_0114452, partial [Trifolium medium]|nr:hypothetical protein [Trifolium medium]
MPQNVPPAPLDNVSFHFEDGSRREPLYSDSEFEEETVEVTTGGSSRRT